MIIYTREQLAKLYKELPSELKDWITTDDTNDKIYQVLKDSDILDERCGQVSDLIRNVLFGLLSPESFQETLRKEAGLDKDLAKKIGHEINRFVFFPVKNSLADLYKIEAESNNTDQPKDAEAETETTTQKPQEEKSKKSDSYLEPME